MTRASVDLPEPLSPDDRQRLALGQMHGHIVQHFEAIGVTGAYMLDLQKRVGLITGLLALGLADTDECAGIVLVGGLDDLLGRAVFDGLAVAQHHDVVGNLGDDGKVMGDVKSRRMRLLDRVLDGGQHIDLCGDVKCRGRLVEDDQFRVGAERHGGHGALQLAAGDLMGIAVAECFGIGQAEHLEQIKRPFFRFRPGHDLVAQSRLDHLFAKLVGRIERGRRRLRDIADLAAADGAHAVAAKRQDVLAVEQHLTAGNGGAAAAIGERRQADGGLACTAFADQAEHLALLDIEGDVFDQGHGFGRLARRIAGCFDLEILDRQQTVIGQRFRHRRALP